MRNSYSVREFEQIVLTIFKSEFPNTIISPIEAEEEIALLADKELIKNKTVYSVNEVYEAIILLRKKRKRFFRIRILLYTIFSLGILLFVLYHQSFIFLLLIIVIGFWNVLYGYYYPSKKVLLRGLFVELSHLREALIVEMDS